MLTTQFLPGTPNWVDLGTPDTDAAAAFYGALFGWRFQSAGPDSGGYGFLQQDGKTVAAVGPLPAEGTPSGWTLYFQTPDANATADAVRKAGGTVRVEPMDVATEGRMAQFTDPAGGEFAVWQPGETVGLDQVTVPGSLCWTELHTSDVDGAKSFYRDVFGWVVSDAPMGGFTYTLLQPAGGDDSSGFGGMMPDEAGTPTMWLPYFEVADADAVSSAAAEHGGKVIAAPQDIPQVGRFAVLADPAGAVFAVIVSAS